MGPLPTRHALSRAQGIMFPVLPMGGLKTRESSQRQPVLGRNMPQHQIGCWQAISRVLAPCACTDPLLASIAQFCPSVPSTKDKVLIGLTMIHMP